MNYIITTLKIYIINVLINAIDKRAAFMKQLFFNLLSRVYEYKRCVRDLFSVFLFGHTNYCKGIDILITLNKEEVRELIRQNKNHKLKRTCHHYYMSNDDWIAMRVIAEMRGYDVDTFYRKCIEGLHYV